MLCIEQKRITTTNITNTYKHKHTNRNTTNSTKTTKHNKANKPLKTCKTHGDKKQQLYKQMPFKNKRNQNI